MSKIVQCEICGKAFNKSYVKAHMRLAHNKKSNAGSSARDEQHVIKEILHLYERLSDKKRKELRIRLKSAVSAN